MLPNVVPMFLLISFPGLPCFFHIPCSIVSFGGVFYFELHVFSISSSSCISERVFFHVFSILAVHWCYKCVCEPVFSPGFF